jgi:hypothetical protein
LVSQSNKDTKPTPEEVPVTIKNREIFDEMFEEQRKTGLYWKLLYNTNRHLPHREFHFKIPWLKTTPYDEATAKKIFQFFTSAFEYAEELLKDVDPEQHNIKDVFKCKLVDIPEEWKQGIKKHHDYMIQMTSENASYGETIPSELQFEESSTSRAESWISLKRVELLQAIQ